MSVATNVSRGSFEWLVAILVSWLIPFQLFGHYHVTYFVSLLLWAVPIVCLFPRFLSSTHRGSRRRRAFWWTVAYITIAGAILDYVFGAAILRFAKKGEYLFRIRAIGGCIPIEEFIFYLLGGMAVALVYFWADHHWLAAYNV